MIQELDGIKKQLTELATILNGFKSEAVQLRILDFILGKEVTESNEDSVDTKPQRKKHMRSTTTTKNDSGVKPTNRKIAASGTGAPATLSQLLAENFFKEPRTINDIIEHCKHNKARTFKANEFSGKLARMVRDHKLTRIKNDKKQYEYSKV